MKSRRLQITHLTDNLGFGGTAKSVEVLVKNVNSDQFNSSVICTNTGGVRSDYLQSEGHDVIILDDPLKLRSVICDTVPDLIHYHGSGLDKVYIEQLSSIDDVPFVVTDNFGWPNRSRLNRLADRWYFVSDMARWRYFQLLSVPRTTAKQRKYQRMYNPLSSIDTNSESSPSFTHQFGISPEVPVIGQISRPGGSMKWSSMSTNALIRAAKVVENAVILSVNPPDNIKQQFNRSDISQRVKYITHIDLHHIHTFYDSIDVMAHTSRIGESFGYVIAESLIRGTPVVVNSTPMRDNAQIELVDNGKNGFVANSIKSFAKAVVQLLRDDNKRATFGDAAIRKAQRCYSPKQISKSYEQQYQQVVSENSAQPSNTYRDVDNFGSKYKKMLTDSFGNESLSYRSERLAWKMVSTHIPAYRYFLYHLLRYRRLPDQSIIN